jgi:hypothetical protein
MGRPAPYTVDIGSPYHVGVETYHSSPFSVEYKSEWSFTYTSHTFPQHEAKAWRQLYLYSTYFIYADICIYADLQCNYMTASTEC